MTVQGEQETQDPRRRLALSIWLIGTILIWAVAWLLYAAVVELGTCLLGTAHGGRAESEGWAGVIGLVLMLPAAIIAIRWRRRLLLLLVGFGMAYAAALLALWALSPAIWGSPRCSGGSF